MQFFIFNIQNPYLLYPILFNKGGLIMKTNFERIQDIRKGNSEFASDEYLKFAADNLSDYTLDSENEYIAGLRACEEQTSCDECICSHCCDKENGYDDGWERYFLSRSETCSDQINQDKDFWPRESMESLGYSQSDFV